MTRSRRGSGAGKPGGDAVRKSAAIPINREENGRERGGHATASRTKTTDRVSRPSHSSNDNDYRQRPEEERSQIHDTDDDSEEGAGNANPDRNRTTSGRYTASPRTGTTTTTPGNNASSSSSFSAPNNPNDEPVGGRRSDDLACEEDDGVFGAGGYMEGIDGYVDENGDYIEVGGGGSFADAAYAEAYAAEEKRRTIYIGGGGASRAGRTAGFSWTTRRS